MKQQRLALEGPPPFPLKPLHPPTIRTSLLRQQQLDRQASLSSVGSLTPRLPKTLRQQNSLASGHSSSSPAPVRFSLITHPLSG